MLRSHYVIWQNRTVTPTVRHTTRDLRRHNRSTLVSYLYHQQGASRVELTRASGLSSATVSNVVSGLIGDGMVREAGSEESEGGRPRALLEVRPEFGDVIGVDIGETHIQVGLFDWTLRTKATATYPVTDRRLTPASVVRRVLNGVDKVVADGGVEAGSLLGVGVGVPGAVQPSARGAVAGTGRHPRGSVYAPTLGWSGVELMDMLKPSIEAPLYLDNCARTLGQAEMWLGAGRGAGRAIVALLGVGLGAALTVGGATGHGATSDTSEWGHTVVNVGGAPCRCGSRGCLEAYVGAEAILAAYATRRGSRPLKETDVETQVAELVRRAAEPGAAADVIAEAAEYLGIGIANLVNLLHPDRVVLSGWAGGLIGPAALDGVRDAAARHALPYMYGDIRIELGQLGSQAVAVGAATLPVMQILATGERPAVPAH